MNRDYKPVLDVNCHGRVLDVLSLDWFRDVVKLLRRTPLPNDYIDKYGQENADALLDMKIS